MAQLGIVVGANGSSPSRMALAWAARRAAKQDSPVTIVFAVSSKVGRIARRLMVFGARELPHERALRWIDDAVDIVSTSVPGGQAPEVHIKMVSADPLDTLAELSADADLVVVGARRRPRWAAIRTPLGAALVARAHCPVAVVRDRSPSLPHPAHAPAQVSMSGWTRPPA